MIGQVKYDAGNGDPKKDTSVPVQLSGYVSTFKGGVGTPSFWRSESYRKNDAGTCTEGDHDLDKYTWNDGDFAARMSDGTLFTSADVAAGFTVTLEVAEQ